MLQKLLTVTCLFAVLLSAGCGTPVKEEKVALDYAGAGFVQIFNGADLTGWDGNMKYWSVKDGAITGEWGFDNPLKSNTYLIWRAGEVADFEMHISYKIVKGNSGVQFRSKELEGFDVAGYQADLEVSLEPGSTWTGALYDENGSRQALAMCGQKVVFDEGGKKTVTPLGDQADILKHVKLEDWNDYHIIAVGSEITLKINGVTVAEVSDKQKGKALSSGIVGMQLMCMEPTKVQFKDIWLKKL